MDGTVRRLSRLRERSTRRHVVVAVVWLLLIGGFVAFAVVAFVHDQRAGIPQAKAAAANEARAGIPQAKAAAANEARARIVCPHCQTRGAVDTRQVRVKQGISGGKATGAILTGGASLLATGLSRKTHVTRLSCGACGMVWMV
jgi:hypothetical protein